jgi:HAMP domain-containing protein
MWVLAIILIVALMIPVAAILVDSPLGRSVARRLEGGTGTGTGPTPELRDLQRKVEGLETEIEDLNRTLAGMRDELQFVQRLLEDPHRKKPTA